MVSTTFVESGEIFFDKEIGLEDVYYPYNILKKTVRFCNIDFRKLFIIKNKNNNGFDTILFQTQDTPIRTKVLSDIFRTKVLENIKNYKFKETKAFVVDSDTGDLVWDITLKKPIKIFFNIPPSSDMAYIFSYYLDGDLTKPVKIRTNTIYNLPGMAYVQNYSNTLIKPKNLENNKTGITEFASKVIFELMTIEVGINPKLPDYAHLEEIFSPTKEKSLISEKNTVELEKILQEKSDVIYGLKEENDVIIDTKPLLLREPSNSKFLENKNIISEMTKNTLLLSKLKEMGDLTKDGEIEFDLDLKTGYGISEGYVKDGVIYLQTTDDTFYLGKDSKSNLSAIKAILDLENIVVYLAD